MKHINKKRLSKLLLAVLLLALTAFGSCLKEGDHSSILLNDPQDIPLITDYLPDDLLQMFGEANVNFGDQPPMVDMEFVSNHEYVATSLNPPFAPPVGTITPIKHYHKISQQYLQIADYYSMSSEETNCHLLSPVFLTGYGNRFTVYYFEEPDTDAKPVHAVLLSGQMTSAGIRDFMYGYKIVRYNDSIVPPTVYPANSIFVFKDHDGLAEKVTWFDESLLEQ
jgi:hypothetical protein